MFGIGKPARPKAVAFDVIGTLFPLEPLRPRITDLRLPKAALEGWYSAALRDAFALAAAGDFTPFADVLEEALDGVLAEQGVLASKQQKEAVLAGMKELAPRPDTGQAFATLAGAGIAVIALSNGSRSNTKTLLGHAGLEAAVAHVVSADDVKLSKPRPEVYQHAAAAAGIRPAELALVASHPFDVNGALAAGLVGAYLAVDRPYPSIMRKPDLQGSKLAEIAEAIVAL